MVKLEALEKIDGWLLRRGVSLDTVVHTEELP